MHSFTSLLNLEYRPLWQSRNSIMSNLLNLENVCLAFGLEILLDNIKLNISPQERICLIGRNGAGKSSLLKIIEGSLLPDSGTVWRKPQLRIARLEQELPHYPVGTVYQFVAQGLLEMGKLIAEYHTLTLELHHSAMPEKLARLSQLQQQIDSMDGWQYEQKIKNILQQLSLNPDQEVAELSGGWQRRVALAKVLVASPELLLLDEPTNHLDIDAVQWLEDILATLDISLLFITHDRALLQRLATRIIELDRGKLTSWSCSYHDFLQHKEELLHAEEKQNATFDKKLAQEERWIRQGIKARRTRNEGRVRALEKMRLERSKRRNLQGKATFNLNEVKLSGHLVIEAIDISHSFNAQPIIKNFSLNIMRGDRIGLIGPNGIGKSTLLNILLGKLVPEQGIIKIGTNLQIAYFDQLRHALDLEKTVIDNVVQGSDMIQVNGTERHIISYLGDFLFTPQRARTPVKALSGGECNRLLLARLFSQPANLLVLDEPTNDLDIETLELLEELLSSFPGTLLIVSHDRIFLDNVVTSTLVFEGEGKIVEFIGGYQDWLKQANPEQKIIEKKLPAPKARTKLNNKEQRELSELPQKIATLEDEQQQLLNLTASQEFYQQNAEKIQVAMERLQAIEIELEEAYARWLELER